jgi:hypothetical protein
LDNPQGPAPELATRLPRPPHTALAKEKSVHNTNQSGHGGQQSRLSSQNRRQAISTPGTIPHRDPPGRAPRHRRKRSTRDENQWTTSRSSHSCVASRDMAPPREFMTRGSAPSADRTSRSSARTGRSRRRGVTSSTICTSGFDFATVDELARHKDAAPARQPALTGISSLGQLPANERVNLKDESPQVQPTGWSPLTHPPRTASASCCVKRGFRVGRDRVVAERRRRRRAMYGQRGMPCWDGWKAHDPLSPRHSGNGVEVRNADRVGARRAAGGGSNNDHCAAGEPGCRAGRGGASSRARSARKQDECGARSDAAGCGRAA